MREAQMVSHAEAVKDKHLVEYFSEYFDSRSAMGNSIGHIQRETNSARGTKRQRPSDDELKEKSRIEEENLSTPRRKKVKTTSSYIFDTLFINGESSDVTVVALGREWKLHRVYLCQATYFSAMFSGSWKESSEPVIHIDIADSHVTQESLHLAFGSLYQDEVTINPQIVVNMLATAMLLGMDGLLQQCIAVMTETINSKSVCDYYEMAEVYGQTDIQKACLTWLEQNIMASSNTDLIRKIDSDLMKEIIYSPSLFVMQVEMDIYSALKKWLFLQCNPTWNEDIKELTQHTDKYYKEQTSKAGCEFLDTELGQPYVDVFRGLRLQHIINDLLSTRILEEDRIIPKTWLLPMYRRQWLQMLRVEQGQDKGPDTGELDNFLDTSLRCGRVLNHAGEYCWRWTGYNFGVDLLVSFTNRMVIFKRNTVSQTCPGGVSMQNQRSLIYKLTVASFDSLGHARFCKTSGVKRITLGKDEEAVIMNIDKQVQFPLHLSCNFLLYTPKHASRKNRNSPQKQAAANQNAASGDNDDSTTN